MKKLTPILVTGTLASLVTFNTVNAQAIYSDAFDRGSIAVPVDLNASAPTVDNGPDLNGWFGPESTYQTNGSLLTESATTDTSAWLDFTPSAGNIYLLSAEVTLDNTDGSFATVGFGIGNSRATTQTNVGNRNLIFSIRGNNFTQASVDTSDWTLASSAGAFGSNIATGGGNDGLLEIVLDLTGEASAWNASFRYNSNIVETATFDGSSISDLGIVTVGLGVGSGADASFDNFSLSTVAIPESNQSALVFGFLIVAGMSLGRFRNPKKSKN